MNLKQAERGAIFHSVVEYVFEETLPDLDPKLMVAFNFIRFQIDKQIDKKALDQYLTLEYCLTPRTMVKGIKKLPPAHFIILQRGKIHIHPYWEIKNHYSSSDNLKELL